MRQKCFKVSLKMRTCKVILLLYTVVVTCTASPAQTPDLLHWFMNIFEPSWTAWSGWGPCHLGSQNRSRCDQSHYIGCEVVQKSCSVASWSQWSDWGPCGEGGQARARCEQGGSCEDQTRDCVGEWGPCEGGWQARRMCTQDSDCAYQDRECRAENSDEDLNDISTVVSDHDQLKNLTDEWEIFEVPVAVGKEVFDVLMGENNNIEALATGNMPDVSEDGSHNFEVLSVSDNSEETAALVENPVAVPEDGRWSDWTPCHQGFKNRTKCEDWDNCKDINSCRPLYDCETEEESCEKRSKLGTASSWTEWSACTTFTQERIRCEDDLGCEVEERPCGHSSSSSWSEWGPCVEGMQERSTCEDGLFGCETEEKPCQMEVTGKWSDWSACKEGTQERLKCEKEIGCEIEERLCGLAVETTWSEWGPCIGGTQERSTCGDHYGCEQEERPCAVHHKIREVGEWSEWEACVKGSRERIRCEEEMSCEVEEESCGPAAEAEGHFPAWSSCDEMGLAVRSSCDLAFGCELQETSCDQTNSAAMIAAQWVEGEDNLGELKRTSRSWLGELEETSNLRELVETLLWEEGEYELGELKEVSNLEELELTSNLEELKETSKLWGEEEHKLRELEEISKLGELEAISNMGELEETSKLLEEGEHELVELKETSNLEELEEASNLGELEETYTFNKPVSSIKVNQISTDRSDQEYLEVFKFLQ